MLVSEMRPHWDICMQSRHTVQKHEWAKVERFTGPILSESVSLKDTLGNRVKARIRQLLTKKGYARV